MYRTRNRVIIGREKSKEKRRTEEINLKTRKKENGVKRGKRLKNKELAGSKREGDIEREQET